MKILLYNPDNGVTRNFMPHLWMFLLQALTPPGHEVVLIDANAQLLTVMRDGIGVHRLSYDLKIARQSRGCRSCTTRYEVADGLLRASVDWPNCARIGGQYLSRNAVRPILPHILQKCGSLDIDEVRIGIG